MNDGFRKALQEIADQDVTEVIIDPGWPSRIAKAALAALPADIAPNHLEQARAELVAVIQRGTALTAKEAAAGLERFVEAKIAAANIYGGVYIE